jgi:transcriptional regulator with XRE-family HTH domain
MANPNPVVRRRQLGQALKKAREDAGMTREDAAEALGTSGDTVGRYERGEITRVQLTLVRALLDQYGITDKAVRAELEALAKHSREAGWWHNYRSALRPGYARLIGLESAASEVRTFESSVIPGILQTPEYARAIIRAAVPPVPLDGIEDRVKVRAERQGRLFADGGPRIHVVLDEGALVRQVGDGDVWRAQLLRVADLAEQSRNLTVQVLRFEAGAPPTPHGSFMLLRLRDGNVNTWVAYTETPTGDRYEEGSEADRYLSIFDQLMASGTDPKLTPDIIDKLIINWGRDQ